jgi:hypothetical protein
MGKVVKTVGKIAGVVAGIAAIATGVGAVLGGTMMFTAFGGAIAASTIAAGAGAVSALAGMLAGGSKIPQSETQLGRLQARLDTQAPRKIVLGPVTAMPADIRYYEGSGTDDEFVDYILAVAGHRIGSVDEIWFEDELAWTAAGGVQGIYSGYLTAVDIRLEGTAANTIAINGGTRWGADDRLTGCAYLRLRVKRTGKDDKEQSPLASGLPGRVTIIGAGMPMYDPRFDSSVGGSGTQRIDDQDSWGPSSGNLIIQALNVLIGWRIAGQLSVGAGLPAKYLDLDSAMTAANVCDEAIALASGGSQPRYRGAGAFNSGDAPMNIVGALLAGCAGDLLDSDGRLSFLIKANTLALPAVTFDDHDVVSAARWDPMGGQTNLPNIIAGSFVDPGALYQMVPYPSVKLASEDGIERTASVDFGVVENAAQAERLAKQTLQRMQYPGTFSAEYNMKGMAATIGSIVWQTYSPRGWLDKPFRVVSQKPSRSGRIALVLREEHADIYRWAAEDSAAVQAAEPVGFDPRNAGPILLARKASETANWPQVSDPNGTKPEDNATLGATLPEPGSGETGNLHKPGGAPWLPDELANRSLLLRPAKDGFAIGLPGGDLISQIRTVDTGAAEASALGVRDRELAEMGERIIEVLAQRRSIDRNLRDAGIAIDPASGIARFYALERTDERVTDLSITVDAQAGLIEQRATRTYVDNAIALAVLDPSQVPVFGQLEIRIGEAETRLDAAEAAITQRATLIQLTAATGRITTAEQRLDAVEGLVQTKVESTEFDQLADRVTTAQQDIEAFGDAASVRESVTAATYLPRTQREADERAVMTLAQLRAAQREAAAAVASARRELTVLTNDGLSAEARARLELAVRTGQNAASILAEQQVRSDTFGSLAREDSRIEAKADAASASVAQEVQNRIAALNAEAEDRVAAINAEAVARGEALTTEQQARIDAVNAERDARIAALAQEAQTREASISSVDQARIDGDAALAQSLQETKTRVGANEASVTTLSESVGGLRARHGVRLDVNGRILGWEAFNDGETGSIVFVSDLFAIVDPDGGDRTEYADGVWRIYAGEFMKAIGSGFGTNGQFVDWYGPACPIAECSEANAISYQRRDGSAYFGGTLSAGITKNAAKTTSIAPDAFVATGKVGSRGGARVVVLSYSYTGSQRMTGACPVPSGNSAASVGLYRGETLIGTLQTNGSVTCAPGNGQSEPGEWRETIAGSITVTDNSGGLEVEYTARLLSRTRDSAGAGADPAAALQVEQTISIVQTEE